MNPPRTGSPEATAAVSSFSSSQHGPTVSGRRDATPPSPLREDHEAASGRGSGMMALLLGRPSTDDDEESSSRYYPYDADFGWRPPSSSAAAAPPSSTAATPSSTSAVSSFHAYPFEGTSRPGRLQPIASSSSSTSSTSPLQTTSRDEQLLYTRAPNGPACPPTTLPTSATSASPAASPTATSTKPPTAAPNNNAFGFDVPYYLHLPRPSLPSFEPMLPTAMVGFSPSFSSSMAPLGTTSSSMATAQSPHLMPMETTTSDLFSRTSWPSISFSSLPDVFRPSILFAPSSASSGYTRGDSASSSTSSSFSSSPPTHIPTGGRAWSPTAWRPSSPGTSPDSSSASSSFSLPEMSASAMAPTATASDSAAAVAAARMRRKRSSSAAAESVSGREERKREQKKLRLHQPPASAPAQQMHQTQKQPSSSTRKPILRRKMEEEYYHYLKEKLSRMETTRKKREQAGFDTMTSTSCPVSLSSSPESSDLSFRSSPELVAPTPDELRKEEEQLYVSGTAMECFRHFYEKISSFLVVENVELANEEWLKSVLRSIVCQVTPFALKINAILAFGALISGQRHWADIFFDKWRRLLTEFFDSSDYEVAEGLAVMSYYLFYLGDSTRARCYAESAAEISVRARAGGGLMFIRAQTMTEILAANPGALSDVGSMLYLKKPLLTFPPGIEEPTKMAISGLLEQLILASSKIHMWRTTQHIAECAERSKRGRRRRKSASESSGGISSKKRPSANVALSSPLHLLSVLQAIEEKLENLEIRQREAATRKAPGGGRKGSLDAQQPLAPAEAAATIVTNENNVFLSDLLAFTRFVLFSVRADCHREAGMTKNAYLSAEKILIQLEKEGGRLMKFVMALSPLVLSFVSPIIELLCGPLQAQFLTAADSLRAVNLLSPLRDIFPNILPLRTELAQAVPFSTVSSSTTSASC